MDIAENFEGGTNGSEVTTSNSIFTTVAAPRPTFTNAVVKHGALACSIDPTATVPFQYQHSSSVTNHYSRFYMRVNAHPSAVQAFYLVRDSGTTDGLQLRITSAGLLQARSQGATQTVATTTAIATGAWIRIECRLTAGASGSGSMEVRLFNSPDSPTPTETISHNSWDGIAAPQTWRFTRLNDASITTHYLDSFAGSDVGWIGPFGGFPNAPTGLTATPVSATQINLDWDDLSGATAGYDVERDGAIIATNHPSSSYSDTGLSPSTLFSYRVRGKT